MAVRPFSQSSRSGFCKGKAQDMFSVRTHGPAGGESLNHCQTLFRPSLGIYAKSKICNSQNRTEESFKVPLLQTVHRAHLLLNIMMVMNQLPSASVLTPQQTSWGSAPSPYTRSTFLSINQHKSPNYYASQTTAPLQCQLLLLLGRSQRKIHPLLVGDSPQLTLMSCRKMRPPLWFCSFINFSACSRSSWD